MAITRRTALVTGAGKNIGRACAHALAGEGFDVVINGSSDRAACDAVAREVYEEVKVRVKNVTYRSSQPWPFPASLMIGCLADALTDEVTIDHDELEDARFFTRDEVRLMLQGQHPEGLLAPQPMAIANAIMRAWALDGERV